MTNTTNIASVWGIGNQRLSNVTVLLLADANVRSVPMEDALTGLICALTERLAAVVLTRASLTGVDLEYTFGETAELLKRIGVMLELGKQPTVGILG